MTDKSIIEKAYELKVQELYSTLFDAFVISEAKEERAEIIQKFRKGVVLARSLKETALKVI